MNVTTVLGAGVESEEITSSHWSSEDARVQVERSVRVDSTIVEWNCRSCSIIIIVPLDVEVDRTLIDFKSVKPIKVSLPENWLD